jgi:hypothetical protein
MKLHTDQMSFAIISKAPETYFLALFIIWPPFGKYSTWAVLALTHLPEVWHKENWIRTSENHERICLNKNKFFSKFSFLGK